jgi:predicted patatin/cPLA2 family phospholipase
VDVTIREYRLDLKQIFERLKQQKKEYVIVASSVETGKASYLEPDEQTLEHYLKASSSLPVFIDTF